AVAKLRAAVGGDVQGRRVVVTAGTGPVGLRAAGLFAKAGAQVVVTSRRAEQGPRIVEAIRQRFAAPVSMITMADPSQAASVLASDGGAELLLNAGPPGACLIPRDAWTGRSGLRGAADVNAVPPLGVEGIEVSDDGVER